MPRSSSLIGFRGIFIEILFVFADFIREVIGRFNKIIPI